MTTAIRIENVSKLYRLGTVGTGTMAHDLNRWWHQIRGKEDPYAKVGQVNDRTKKAGKSSVVSSQSSANAASANCQLPTANSAIPANSQQPTDDSRGFGPEYVWALRDINLEVQQGEILGIIGRNGAGKSTLLKLLSRVTAPTTGSIKAKGRIASLLEVGTGFHPDLTGRENIYMNGAILGMRRHEITKQLDEIVDFSGCVKYLDTPVKRYSSGMTVRLGFAVAAHLSPETLIVDEVLAVGDASFQDKCLGKMASMGTEGRTVIFVSHNMAAIERLTKTAVVLNNGVVSFRGDSQEAVDVYLDRRKRELGTTLDAAELIRNTGAGDGSLKFRRLEWVEVNSSNSVEDTNFRVKIAIEAAEEAQSYWIGLTLHYRDGTPICSMFSAPFGPIKGTERREHLLGFRNPGLAPGSYWITLGLLKCNCELVDMVDEVLHFDIEGSGMLPRGFSQWNPSWGRFRVPIDQLGT